MHVANIKVITGKIYLSTVCGTWLSEGNTGTLLYSVMHTYLLSDLWVIMKTQSGLPCSGEIRENRCFSRSGKSQGNCKFCLKVKEKSGNFTFD